MPKMLKRLLILASLAAAMLMTALPTFAQPQVPPESNIRIAGVIQQVAPTPEGTSFFITEDSTGDEYDLSSDAKGVNLSQYAGQRVIVNGVIQAVGSPVYVTSVEIPEDSPVGKPVSVTGVLESRGFAADRADITHFLTDETSGEMWGMISGDPASILDPYNGQRVTVSGTNATEISFAGDEIPAINVDKVEPLEKNEKPAHPPTAPDGQYEAPAIPAPVDDNPGQYDDGDGNGSPGGQYDDGADKDVPPTDNGSPNGDLSNGGSSGSGSSGGVLSVLPDTGGLSPVTIGLISAMFLSGGLLTYAAIRQR